MKFFPCLLGFFLAAAGASAGETATGETATGETAMGEPATGEPAAVKPEGPEPTKNYLPRTVEGWTVLVHPALAREQPQLLEQTLKLLEQHLYQIDRTVPAEATGKLRTVKIWIENFDPHHPCMCYHPDPGWLRRKKLNPDKARGVEIAHPGNFLQWTLAQPWMVFHELAHAYHHQFLPDGFQNDEVATAFVKAVESKSYQSVLHIDGSKRKHYALTNPMEYFAESSEAYFGTNDFFPFVRAELKNHDPDMCELLGKLWLVKKPAPRKQP